MLDHFVGFVLKRLIVTDIIITDEAVSTFLSKVESLINSCALTTVRDEINDWKPITHTIF